MNRPIGPKLPPTNPPAPGLIAPGRRNYVPGLVGHAPTIFSQAAPPGPIPAAPTQAQIAAGFQAGQGRQAGIAGAIAAAQMAAGARITALQAQWLAGLNASRALFGFPPIGGGA